MKHLVRRLALAALLLLPTVAAAVWTVQPAAFAALATLTYEAPPMKDADWDDPERLVDVRRRLQKHFLQHGVYIPLEDIIAPAPQDEAAASQTLIMQKACGRARLYVWIPFKFRLPIQGEKVLEWCWKPQTKESSANA